MLYKKRYLVGLSMEVIGIRITLVLQQGRMKILAYHHFLLLVKLMELRIVHGSVQQLQKESEL